MLFPVIYIIILLNDYSENCPGGYVLGRYANAVDVVNLNWLPILESSEYNISKLTYQGLNDTNWSSYLPVEIVTQKKNSAFQ